MDEKLKKKLASPELPEKCYKYLKSINDLGIYMTILLKDLLQVNQMCTRHFWTLSTQSPVVLKLYRGYFLMLNKI